jgi:60 kDa SS-A/Ro ribonucleoprotein
MASVMERLPISKSQRLDTVMKKMAEVPMGGTDCALPMLDALAQKIPVDCFIIYTDNETWAGKIHPSQALNDYRQKMGIDAKLIVCGMTATGFTIADPKDKGMLDIVGFDTAVPSLISQFVSGGTGGGGGNDNDGE